MGLVKDTLCNLGRMHSIVSWRKGTWQKKLSQIHSSEFILHVNSTREKFLVYEHMKRRNNLYDISGLSKHHSAHLSSHNHTAAEHNMRAGQRARLIYVLILSTVCNSKVAFKEMYSVSNVDYPNTHGALILLKTAFKTEHRTSQKCCWSECITELLHMSITSQQKKIELHGTCGNKC